MEIKHTPGPWVVGASDFLEQWVCIDAPSGDRDLDYKLWEGIAMAYGCEESPGKGLKKAKANAYLIAAAPELLEALEMIVSEADSYTARTGKPIYNWLDQARAAIAKAKGEEQR